MKNQDMVLVVFDGTSVFIAEKDDITTEEIIGEFYTMEEASYFCEMENESVYSIKTLHLL